MIRATLGCALVVLAACDRSTSGSSSVARASVAPSSPSSSAAPAPRVEDGRLAVVRAWNDAHVAHDANALSALYADRVRFYGATLVRAECVSRVAGALKKHPDENQKIKDLFVDGNTVHFTKTIVARRKAADYHAYLELEPRGAGWAITAESDTLTDQNLAPCTSLDWSTDEGNSIALATLTGHLGCGLVAPGFPDDPDTGSFCVLELDKPICLPKGSLTEETVADQVDLGGDPHDLWNRYGADAGKLVVKGTVHTAGRHAVLGIYVDSIRTR